jgi:hypothetical protein
MIVGNGKNTKLIESYFSHHQQLICNDYAVPWVVEYL